MRREHPVPEELRGGPVTIAMAAAAGLTRDQLRSASWRRVAPGTYVWAGDGGRLEVRLAGWLQRLSTEAVFSGHTAAQVYGCDVGEDKLVEVTVPVDGLRPVGRGVRVFRSALDPEDVAEVKGLRVTSPVRTWFDLARRPPLQDAVAAVDWALHNKRIALPALRRYMGDRPKKRGVPQARRVLELCDARAESVMESRLRVLLVDNGLPPPEVQYPVRDAWGAEVRRLDLCYPQVRLGIEYDGDTHRANLVDDNRRQNWLLSRGFVLLRFTASDLYRHSDAVVAQVRSQLARSTTDWQQTVG